MIYAFDSNILSALLKKDSHVEEKLKAAVDSNNQYVIPPIVYYEVKRWLVLKRATAQLAAFENFCRLTPQISIDQVCLEKSIEIYTDLIQRGTPVGDFDILIAAYCIVNGYTLVTDNTREFERINGLKHTNWKERDI